MKFLNHFILLGMSVFFISCGENTTLSPLKDIASIQLNETNISIYATQAPKILSANVNYTDGTSADATKDIAWSTENSDVFLAATGSILASANGGDANLSINYPNSTFSDITPVHVKSLESINYTDINISDSSNAQTIYVTANYENNETNVTMESNIYWSTDTNATISEANATQITLTLESNITSFLLTGTLFVNTANAVDFNKTFK